MTYEGGRTIDSSKDPEAAPLIPPETDILVTKRKLYTQSEFDDNYATQTKSRTVCDVIRATCRCSAKCAGTYAINFLPVVKFVRRYQWRQWIVADVLAGLTVGTAHLPQALAYALLATLRPVTGLYTSFFPIVVYMLFGTSPHMSIGTNAVVSLLTANVVQGKAEAFVATSLGTNSTPTEEEIMDYKTEVATATCFVIGPILFAMGIFRLGFITNYFSKSFIGGFTFASAVHIATSQIPKMLQLKLPTRSGAGRLSKTYEDIFSNIAQTNAGDVIVGVICMGILLGVKLGVNERYKDKLKVPIPIDLILVILSTIVSHFAEFNRRFHIAVVGPVPMGMPTPALPQMEIVPAVAAEAFVIAILGFALSITLAKLCAKQHSYDIDDNQELIANGLCNFVGAFFGNYPSGNAPPRTMLLNSLGVKTTLNAVPTAVFILLVLLVIGKLFESLPIAMLAAMIIVAIKDLLLQFRNLPSLWRVNKPDFFIWLITASVSIVGDLDLGLLAGVTSSVFSILVVSQLTPGKLLGKSESEDVILTVDRKGAQPVSGVRIFRFETLLHFASAENFKNQLFSVVFNPRKWSKRRQLLVRSEADTALLSLSGVNGETEGQNQDTVHHVILDCSAMTYVDVAGIDMLQITAAQFSRAGVEIFLASVPSPMMTKLRSSGFMKTFGEEKVFYTVFDALQRAKPLN